MKRMRKTLGIGIHNGVPMEKYLADPCASPSLSSSIAHTLITQSPYHAWFNHKRLNKKYVKESNGHFDFGTAAHSFILEGAQDFVVIDAEDYRKKEVKEQRDTARNEGKTPILAEQYNDVLAMAKAFHSFVDKCPDLQGVFQRGKPEQTGIWKEGKTWFRIRMDWLTDTHDLIINYKTSENANPENFVRGNLINFGYDLQAAFYLRGLRALSKKAQTANYIWIVQEIKSPYAVSFIGFGDQMADIANRKVERAIALWNECIAKKSWPSYSPRVAWASLPTWAVQRFEEYEASQGLLTSSEQLQ
jgi:hypothetical protein